MAAFDPGRTQAKMKRNIMKKPNWLIARARWLAFIPALWLSMMVHKWVLLSLGPLPDLLSYSPSEEFVTKMGFLMPASDSAQMYD
jgi:hypothetical protein